ncbi:MAG: hypothetical protein ACR2PG_27670 [Hyphomicrobiaceae bacterium]
MKVLDAVFSSFGQDEFWEGVATFDDGITCNFTARRDGTVRMRTYFRRRQIPECRVRSWRSAKRDRAIREFFEIAETTEASSLTRR